MDEDPIGMTRPSGPTSARVPTTGPDPACGPPREEEGPRSLPRCPCGRDVPTGERSCPACGRVLCAQCWAFVAPKTPDHCPVCGGWVVDNAGHLVLGLRSKKLSKEADGYGAALLDEIFRERGGREALDVVSRIACENYVFLCKQQRTIEERLDRDTLFTATGRKRSAFDMAKSVAETIDRLRAELPPPIARPTQEAAIAAMPEADLRAAEILLTRQIELMERKRDGKTLTDFERGELSILTLDVAMNSRLLRHLDPLITRAIVEPPVVDTTPPIVAPDVAPRPHTIQIDRLRKQQGESR